MQSSSERLALAQLLFRGAAIVSISMGIRRGFGLWLQPITQDCGWRRETFACTLAVQNLFFGGAGIFAGMLANRLSAFRVTLGESVLHALGFSGMAQSGTTYKVNIGVFAGLVNLTVMDASIHRVARASAA